jgi:hypothetical protein
MPETIDGLPSHPLVVHLPVVLGPIVGLLAILLLASPLRARLLTPTAILAVLFALSAAVAVQTGEDFADRLALGDSIAAHEEAAELLRILAFLLAGLLVALAIVRDRLPGPLSAIAFIAVALLGAATVAQTVKTGHEGAEHVWGGSPGVIIAPSSPR